MELAANRSAEKKASQLEQMLIENKQRVHQFRKEQEKGGSDRAILEEKLTKMSKVRLISRRFSCKSHIVSRRRMLYGRS